LRQSTKDMTQELPLRRRGVPLLGQGPEATPRA
jgi:hypothetical protein